jgi:hypothetical protein
MSKMQHIPIEVAGISPHLCRHRGGEEELCSTQTSPLLQEWQVQIGFVEG